MIYEKNGAAFPDKTRYWQIFEYMFVLSKGKPKTINLIKDRKNKWGSSWGRVSERLKSGELKKRKNFFMMNTVFVLISGVIIQGMDLVRKIRLLLNIQRFFLKN